MEAHQAGRLGEAARLYIDILSRNKDDADALHLLGVLRHQQGDHGAAVELIAQAIAQRPSVPAFHANLAEAYRAQGKFDRAEGCCRMALRLQPDYPEASCNLGLALHGLKRFPEAVEHFEHALALRPAFPAAHNNFGITLRELERFDEALQHFQHAVDLDPSFAAARTNLGQMLLALGKAEEALAHAQEAVQLLPDRAAVHHNLGNALRVLDRSLEARAAFLEAIRLDPNLAMSSANLGLLLQQDGQMGDAEPWLKQAAAMEPTNPLYHQHLAELYEEWEEPARAIPCWETVLMLNPDRADVRLSLGWALQDQNRMAEAEEQYRKALETCPNFAAAHFNLGGLQEELGRMTEAEECFRVALRLQPDYALPHVRLATLLRGKLPDADLTAMEERLNDARLGPRFRCRMLFGLAHALDGRGDYSRAAECLREANHMAREAAKGWRKYEPADHEHFIDCLVDSFTPELFQRTAGMGLETHRPVFIFGLPRSGTTLVEQVLSAHSRIHGAGELIFARQSFEAMPRELGLSRSPRECIGSLTESAIRSLGNRHLEELRKLDNGRAERIVDKMPDNYMYVGLLAVLFPHAVFIHCRRDLRDIAVSCWMTDFRSIRWANDPEHIASRFRQYRRLMDHWQNVLPVSMHHVDYEDTVSDLEGVARRLTAACGLEFEASCLNFHSVNRPIRTASVAQVREPIYKKSVARWKNYEKELAELFAALPE
jgi:tetratricopeptide (TPR) repeat protein